MIAKLFYPRELKSLIKELEAEGALNARGLYEINRLFYFFTSMGIIGFITAYLFASGIFEFWLLTIVSSMGVVMGAFSVRVHSKRDVLPYTKGMLVEGMIDKKTDGYLRGIKALHYSFQLDGDHIKGSRACLDSDIYDKAQIGPVKIFVNPHQPENHSVFLPDRLNVLCLDKRRIEEFGSL